MRKEYNHTISIGNKIFFLSKKIKLIVAITSPGYLPSIYIFNSFNFYFSNKICCFFIFFISRDFNNINNKKNYNPKKKGKKQNRFLNKCIIFNYVITILNFI